MYFNSILILCRSYFRIIQFIRNSYEKSSSSSDQALKNLSAKCIIDYVNLLNHLWENVISKNKTQTPPVYVPTSAASCETHLSLSTNEGHNSYIEKEVNNFIRHLEIYFLYLHKRQQKKQNFNFEPGLIEQLSIINVDFELKKFSIDYYLYMEEGAEEFLKTNSKNNEERLKLNPKQIYILAYYLVDLNHHLQNLIQNSINFKVDLNEALVCSNFKVFHNSVNNSLTSEEQFDDNNQFLRGLFLKIVNQNLISKTTSKLNNKNISTMLNLNRKTKYNFNNISVNINKETNNTAVNRKLNSDVKLIIKLFKCSWTYLCEVLIDYICHNYNGKHYNECLACVFSLCKQSSNELNEKNLDFELNQLFHLIYEYSKSTKHYTDNSFNLTQLRLIDFILHLTSTISLNKCTRSVESELSSSISIFQKYFFKFSFLFINQQKIKTKEESHQQQEVPQQQDDLPTILVPLKITRESNYSFLDFDYSNLNMCKNDMLNSFKLKIEASLTDPSAFKQLILFSLSNIFNTDHDSFLNNNFLNYNSLIIDKINELLNNSIKTYYAVSSIHIINQLQYFVNNYILRISEKAKTDTNFISVLRVLVRETIHKTSLSFIQLNLDYYEAYLNLHENINENLLDLLNKYFNFNEYFLDTYDLLSDIKNFETNDLLLVCLCELVDCFSANMEMKWKNLFNILKKMKFISLLGESISSSRDSIVSLANQDQCRSQFNTLVDILNVYLKSKTLTCAFDFISCLRFFLSYEVSKAKNQNFDDDFEECIVDLDDCRENNLNTNIIINDTFNYAHLNRHREDSETSVFVKPFLNCYKMFFDYLLDLHELNFKDNRKYDEYKINFSRLKIENSFEFDNFNDDIYELFNRFYLKRLDENKIFNCKFEEHIEDQNCSLNTLLVYIFESM